MPRELTLKQTVNELSSYYGLFSQQGRHPNDPMAVVCDSALKHINRLSGEGGVAVDATGIDRNHGKDASFRWPFL
ncbi:MAG: hypothetical protein AB7I42_25795 [Bradyrhizobium sp.]|uniref:hypothetical protein n=1 Tax=Bradyrhizobium sp. TaxID=376 RepID=UPI003D0DEDAC